MKGNGPPWMSSVLPEIKNSCALPFPGMSKQPTANNNKVICFIFIQFLAPILESRETIPQRQVF